MITKLGATLSLAILFASPCLAQDVASQKFLKEAIEGNLAEVQMGQLAQKQATSDGVRSFGQMLEKDHSDANKKAVAAASSVGVTPPTEPNKKQKADYDKMAKLPPAQFDKAFVTHMVADHKKDIKEYEKASKKKDAAGTYASETLPVLRKHLDTAQSLSAGKTANQKASPPAVMAVPAPAAGVPPPTPETTAGDKAR
jgi:putative membrane protein